MKGMRMQSAEQILQAVRKLGEKRVPLTRVYRCLFNENLFLAAYNKLYRNEGALTPGTVEDTVDGMSHERIAGIIQQLRHEQFKFRPSRRIQIDKKSGKGKRPLSIPNFTEKLVQEVLRMLLEAYYEPRFRDSSHGFRPARGCHTALARVKEKFIGTVWLIEGDIKGCFDNVDHNKLISILAKDIHDGRLLNLIRGSLKAGVMEGWQYRKTYSGTPQGSVLSPLLANIYLNELDAYIENTLIPQYTRGKRRAVNLKYHNYHFHIRQARKRGDKMAVQQLEQERRQLPSQDTHDPLFRRLRYTRYADDFLLGFIGSKSEAKAIKAEIGAFLKNNLHLEMSQEKTLITHARTQHAQFLGYAVSIYHSDSSLTRRITTQVRTRNINGIVRLGIPYGWADQYAKRYQRGGKPQCEPALLSLSDADIISIYQQRYRGIAEYYKYAVDRCRLSKLKHVMETAMTKTLAHKFKISVSKVYRKYHGTRKVDDYEYKTIQVEVPTRKGIRTIYWGAIPLKVRKIGSERLNDRIYQERSYRVRSELIQRLRADTCELCGTEGKCEVHHVRKLANLKKRWAGRKSKPEWVVRMIAMRRKTLVVCKKCHVDTHAGRPIPKERMKVLESRVR
jgi:group II intron reverse transcriptase/maturase